MDPIFNFIKPENIIVDLLHLFLRISDKLLSILSTKITQMDLTWQKDMNKNKNLKSFVNFLNDIKIKKPCYYENNTYKFRNFNGDERHKIFKSINFKEIFPNMDNTESMQKVWDDFYFLYFDIKDDKVGTIELKLRTHSFLDNYRDISCEDTTTPYIHILISHVYQQIEYLRTKNLFINSFSMQGIEKLNDFLTKYYQRSSNKKGELIKQVLQKRSRIEILNHHDNLPSILDF